MDNIIIDDNLDFLNQISKKGFITFYSQGKNLEDLIYEISNQCDSVNEVFINISLILNNMRKRLDYTGFVLLKKLMFEIKANKWFLLSFENKENILKKHNALLLSSLKGINIYNLILLLIFNCSKFCNAYDR